MRPPQLPIHRSIALVTSLVAAMTIAGCGDSDPVAPIQSRSPSLAKASVIIENFTIPASNLGPTKLYGGIGRGSGTNKGEVITINQTNGLGTTLGSGATDAVVGINGLAFDASGDLFASTISAPLFGFPQGVGTLIKIDPLTGVQSSFIGAITLSGNPFAITDLAVQPGTDVLFGISVDTGTGEGSIYTINKSTAVATLVGGTGLIAASIAFASDGTLYVTSAIFDDGGNFVAGFLNTANPATGAILTTAGPFFTHIGGLTVRPTDGVIFASGGVPGEIYTLSTTGVLNLLGTTGLGGVGDIAFILPPTDKDQCKKGNFVKFGFRNQGQCIQFVNTGK